MIPVQQYKCEYCGRIGNEEEITRCEAKHTSIVSISASTYRYDRVYPASINIEMGNRAVCRYLFDTVLRVLPEEFSNNESTTETSDTEQSTNSTT